VPPDAGQALKKKERYDWNFPGLDNSERKVLSCPTSKTSNINYIERTLLSQNLKVPSRVQHKKGFSRRTFKEYHHEQQHQDTRRFR
jgi:hypothetical protein